MRSPPLARAECGFTIGQLASSSVVGAAQPRTSCGSDTRSSPCWRAGSADNSLIASAELRDRQVHQRRSMLKGQLRDRSLRSSVTPGSKTDQPRVNPPQSNLLARLNVSSISVRSPTPITLKISRSMSVSSSVRARVRALFRPRGFSLTAAVGSLRGLPNFLPVEVAFPSAAVLVFPLRLPVSLNNTLVLLTRVGLIVPSNPAAFQASLTALLLPWGLSLRNSFTKLVLPGVALAVFAMRVSPGWFKPRSVSTGRKNTVHGQRNTHEIQDRVGSSLG